MQVSANAEPSSNIANGSIQSKTPSKNGGIDQNYNEKHDQTNNDISTGEEINKRGTKGIQKYIIIKSKKKNFNKIYHF